MVKDVLEEIAVVEREAFCQQNGAVGNGYYPRGLEGLFGRIEELRVPRTRDGGFRPFFLEPYQRASYELEELVVAMYQGGCSTRDISRIINALIDGRYSATWVSKPPQENLAIFLGIPVEFLKDLKGVPKKLQNFLGLI